MKKLLIGIAGLVLLLVAVIAAAPFVLPALIPVETYKQQIAEGARQATGRELTIKGDFKLDVDVEAALGAAPGPAATVRRGQGGPLRAGRAGHPP
jgi:hypothetical protein